MRSRTLLLSLAAALSLALLMAACLARPPMQTVDLTVQAAQRACQNIPDIERFGCIEQHAVATLNPNVCRLLGIAVDDACLQAVYEAADDPAICDRLYLPGVVPTCKAYYADPNRVPRLLTPTPIPDDARLGWLAYVIAAPPDRRSELSRRMAAVVRRRSAHPLCPAGCSRRRLTVARGCRRRPAAAGGREDHFRRPGGQFQPPNRMGARG